MIEKKCKEKRYHLALLRENKNIYSTRPVHSPLLAQRQARRNVKNKLLQNNLPK